MSTRRPRPLRARALPLAGSAWVGGVLALSAPTARAAEIEARVQVERDQVEVGEQLIVAFEVVREGPGEVPAPQLPAAVEAAFDVGACQTGMGRRVDMFAGTEIQTRTKQCLLVPRQPGEFQLSFAVPGPAGEVHSNAVKIRVTGAGQAVEPATAEGDKPQTPQGSLFAWATTDKMRAYVGEQVTYRLDVYANRNFFDLKLGEVPTFSGFLTEELPVGEVTIETVGGTRYRVHPGLRRALFPQKAGTLEIGAAELVSDFRRRQRSRAIAIEVLPLPAEGQPEGFSPNNVGQYTIAAEVDRRAVDRGQPLTLSVEISGQGNIEVLDPGPWPELDGVRRYDPKVELEERIEEGEVGGTRRYEFLLIPEKAGALTIPPHTLSFFDPQGPGYKTVRTAPIEIEVRGEPTGGPEAPEVAEGKGTDESALALAPIIAIDRLPRHRAREPWLSVERWAWGMAGVPGLLLVGFGGAAAWRRLGPDEAARTRSRARARRQQQIEQARREIESGQGFHGTLATLLHELAVQRAGSEGAGLPRPRLVELLARRGVEPRDLRELQRLLDRCDAARFGAQLGSREERATLLEDALALLRRSSLGKGVA